MSSRPHVLTAIHEWDVFALQRISRGSANSLLGRAARWTSRTGDGFLYPLIPLLILLFGLPAPLSFLKLAVIAFGIERVIYVFAKNSFRRRRPANILPDYHSAIVASDEFSFPSGHSSAAFLVVTLLVMHFGPAFAVLYLWAAMVAASRVFLGVHFPSDTFVGGALGTTIASVTCLVIP